MENTKYSTLEKSLLIRIGNNIKKYRKINKLSQEKLAFECGLDRAYTGRVERGEINISILKLKKISEVLGINITLLLEK